MSTFSITCWSIFTSSGPKGKVKCRASKLSAMEMPANKYNQKAELKDQELELRKMELEFQQKKFEAEA